MIYLYSNKELEEDAVTAGFDYLETSVKLLASYSEEDFIAAAENVKEIPIPVFCGCAHPQIGFINARLGFGDFYLQSSHFL